MNVLEFDGYENELSVALKAVRLACRATANVQKSLKKNEIDTKVDRSPVTVADYASQAIIIRHLSENFDGDLLMVAEEEASHLKNKQSVVLLEGVVETVNEVSGRLEAKELLEAIDLGNHDASSDKFWTLDPID